jgi:hypothetical protein
MALPGVTSDIRDYGLNVSPEPAVRNDSILIIGTAADGPMYEPIPIGNKDVAANVFGSFNAGTLVRGIYEAMDAAIEGTPDIRGMRIGDGKKATLEVAERLSTSSAWDGVTSGAKSLKLQAVYAGSKYNAISIFIDEEKMINIYNPKTGVYSRFSYDDTNPRNTQVDARNVRELVDVINNDANASSVVVASTSGIQAAFEVLVNSADSAYGVSNVNGKAQFDLKRMLSGYALATPGVVQPTGYIFEANVTRTAGNLLDNLEEVFSISVSDPVLLQAKGLTTVDLELSTFDGKGDGRFNTIQAMQDYNNDNFYFVTPSGNNVVSEYMNLLDREVLPNVTTALSTSGWVGELAIKGWHLPPDDSQETLVSGALRSQTVTINGITGTTTNVTGNASSMALAFARAVSGTYSPLGYTNISVSGVGATVADYVNVTASGIASSLDYPGRVIVAVSSTNGQSDSEWTPLLYHAVSGIYCSGFVYDQNTGTGTLTLAIGALASGYTGEKSLVSAGLIGSDGIVKADKYLRISCNTVKGFLSEAETLPNLQAASSDWTTYFVRGQQVLFSDTVPLDVVVNYGVKVNYEPNSDVVVTDPTLGIVKIVSDIQPGPGGNALDATKKSVIGFKYKFLPQFPAITTAAQSLDGGTDGTRMNNAKLYDEFAKAYSALENYETRIVVPMGAFIDSERDSFNSITGLPEKVNAQFQIQLRDYLKKVSVNTKETIGVMGVVPAPGSTLLEIKQYVDRLTVVDFNDPNRAANIMPLFDNYNTQVCAFEPVFDNLGGLPYTANGQAAYAGMFSSLDAHQSPTNKSIPNAIRMRYDLSNAQLESLQAMRMVAMRKKPGRNPVVCDAMTAAASGSDFVRLTTVRITFEAMQVVRNVCDPFIGQPNTAAKRNAMEAAITKGLSALVELGALRKYAFTVSSSVTQQVLGIVDIELVLVPVFEIRTIRTVVKLRTEIPSNG